MTELPEAFKERMRGELKGDYEKFALSYQKPAEKGIRVNTLKITTEEFQKISPLTLDGKVPWAEGGFYCLGEGLGKTILHAAGLYYVQEPSAMSAAPKLNVRPGERVLDLCSAPGGKGTQLAQAMNGEGILVLNEIDFKRCGILASNVERLGIKNAVITCKSPEYLAENICEYFDKILVDAPCSGEGMFKKEANAIPEWSLENVKRCAERQAKILESADKMLAGGGTLVYSTCTFAPEEDEGQMESFLKTHDYKLSEMKKLLPHEARGEGHFYAVLQKQSGERRDLPEFSGFSRGGAAVKYFNEWAKGVLHIEFDRLYQTGNANQTHIYALPKDMPSFGYAPMRSGVQLATVNTVNGKVEPAHALAMSLKAGEAESIEADESTALKFLRGLTFECDPAI
ncbi:MAG: hypothetical protein HDP34_03880, partial [Clostridia bacterium]|nr:hypothetical protein [Clostridia bacterium]